MSKKIPVARVNATGALIVLTESNRNLVLAQPGNVETVAQADPVTGRLIEINGADYTTMIAASMNLQRIGSALLNNKQQRDTLLTAALKIPHSVNYLEHLGVFNTNEIPQSIDQDTLQVPDSQPSDKGAVEITDVTEELAAKAQKQKAKKSSGKKPKSSETTPDLADL